MAVIIAFSQQFWNITTGIALTAIVLMWFLARSWARSSMGSQNNGVATPNIDRINRRALEQMENSAAPDAPAADEPVPDDLIKVVQKKQDRGTGANGL
jgi:hypothetical protein